MFIEVKRCYNEYWKISNRDFDRRVRFAKINGLPLFFAINFTYMNLNLWTLFPADFIKKNGLKVHITQWGNSLFDYIVGNLTVHFKDFELTNVYSKSKKSMLINHPDYGGVERTIISVDDNQFEFSGDDPINLLFYILNSTETEITTNETTIKKRHYISQITTLYQIIIGCVKVLYGGVEDFSIGKYLEKVVKDKEEIVTSDLGYYILNRMKEIGIAQPFIWNPDIF